MPTSTGEELRLFFKCTVIGRGVFAPAVHVVSKSCDRLGPRTVSSKHI